MKEVHLSYELLEELVESRRDLDGQSLEELIFHLCGACPCCAETYRSFKAEREGKARRQGIQGITERLFASLRDQCREIEEQRQAGRQDLATLERLPPEQRPEVIAQSRERFRSPNLVDELLDRAAEAQRGGDPFAALELAECAHLVALRLPEKGLGLPVMLTAVARARGHQGHALRAQGEIRKAGPLLEGAVRLFLESGTGDPLVVGELLGFLARLRFEQSRFDEAEDLLGRSIAAYEECDDRLGVCGARIRQASLYVSQGRPDEALRILEETLRAFERVEDPGLYLRGVHQQVIALTELERHREALALLGDNEEAFHASRDPKWILRYRWRRAILAASLQDWDEAKRGYLLARRGFLELGLVYDAAMVGLELALVFTETGETRQLKELAAEMLPVFLAQEVHRQAVAVLLLFDEAVQREAVTSTLISEVIDVLKTVRFRPRELPS